MGREFVLKLDKVHDFDEMWIIARREDRLLELQKDVNAKIRAIALDLIAEASIDEYKPKLISNLIAAKFLRRK